MPDASHQKVADPAVDTLDKRDVSPGTSRLEDMRNAVNGCGFRAGCGIHMAFPFEGGQFSLHFWVRCLAK